MFRETQGVEGVAKKAERERERERWREEEAERENTPTLGFLRVEGLLSEGLRWSVWRGGGTRQAAEYISRLSVSLLLVLSPS